MAAMAQIFVLGQQIRLLRAFVLVVRHSFLGLVYSCLEVVVDLPFRFDQGVASLAQEKGRMVSGHDGDTLVIEPFAAVVHDAGRAAIEELEGDLAQADDDLWLHCVYFFLQVAVGAEFSFFQGRRAVALGPAFDDVRHVYVVPREANAPQGLIEQLA